MLLDVDHMPFCNLIEDKLFGSPVLGWAPFSPSRIIQYKVTKNGKTISITNGIFKVFIFIFF